MTTSYLIDVCLYLRMKLNEKETLKKNVNLDINKTLVEEWFNNGSHFVFKNLKFLKELSIQ